ncbi:uncharacterized protein LOC134743315 [Cydia strobilella]|uniref:uncharacterized protein LOC134743315 n=1 Tax=Cydia strobilella TaxID=1100964 RepID=UPI003006256F
MEEPKKTSYTSYRYCLVPKCTNTTINTPEKLFFDVPRDVEVRKRWCKLMKKGKLRPKTTFHCCEDHFNVEEDTENYIQYSIMKEQGVKVHLKLKKGIVPHKFKCQSRNRSPPLNQVYSVKRQRLALINEVLSEFAVKNSNISEPPHTSNCETEPGTAIIEHHDTETGSSTAVMDCKSSRPIIFIKEEAEFLDEEVRVKEEPECKETAGLCGVSEAAELAGLYSDHIFKDELVLGPEVPYRPDVNQVVSGNLALAAAEDASSLSLLLCEETIPGSPAPDAESPPRPDLHMPFACAPQHANKVFLDEEVCEKGTRMQGHYRLVWSE